MAPVRAPTIRSVAETVCEKLCRALVRARSTPSSSMVLSATENRIRLSVKRRFQALLTASTGRYRIKLPPAAERG